MSQPGAQLPRVVFDTNIILDVLLRREPYFAASAAALDTVAQGTAEGYVSAHAVTTLAYLLQRQLGTTASKTVLVDLIAKLHVAPVSEGAIHRALAGSFKDFEDAVCHAVAMEAQADVIVTRNVADFAGSAVPAVLPDVYLATHVGIERAPPRLPDGGIDGTD